MPRPRIPSYRHHKASGQAVVTLGGRDVYLGRHGTEASRQAYERAVISWKARGHAPARRSAPTLTVADLVARYWEHVEAEGLYTKNGRPTSERSCIVMAMRPLVRLFGNTPASSFGPRDLRLVRAALCEPLPPPPEGESPSRRVYTGPLVRASVNKHVHRVRRVFRWAVSEQLVPAETWHALRALPPLRPGADRVREGGAVQPAPLRAVAAVLRRGGLRPEVCAMIRLQWLTGARPGEVVQMRMGDVDRTRRVWIYRPGSHKTQHHGATREVLLGPRAQKVLAPFVKADPAAWLFPGRPRRGEKEARHMSENGYCTNVRDACDALGIERWTPNQLRHNTATKVRSTHGLDTASNVLGHSSPNTTLIYAEADRRKAEAFALAHG